MKKSYWLMKPTLVVLRLHCLPLTFNLSLQLKMLTKANYNQQMYSILHNTTF